MSRLNSQANVSPLFNAIIENHNERSALTAAKVLPIELAHTLRPLQQRMAELRRAAEKALCWNKDKGNTA